MRIGLDIDNVITDMDKSLLDEFIKEDKRKRNRGIINKNASITGGMFDWSKEEVKEFFCTHMERIAKTLDVRENAKYYIDKFLEEGHEVYLITHRAYPEYHEPEETTIKWLKDNEINYTKLIFSATPDKTIECKNNSIDVMIDDRVKQCKKMIENKVKCIVMLTRYNHSEAEGMEYAKNWDDLFSKIKKYIKVR